MTGWSVRVALNFMDKQESINLRGTMDRLEDMMRRVVQQFEDGYGGNGAQLLQELQKVDWEKMQNQNDIIVKGTKYSLGMDFGHGKDKTFTALVKTEDNGKTFTIVKLIDPMKPDMDVKVPAYESLSEGWHPNKPNA